MEQTNNYCEIPPSTKVLVTGATGFTGSVLTKKLVAAGLDVHAVARPTSSITPFNSLKITWHRGQVYDKELLETAAADAQYIFHVAAAFREAKVDENEYRRVHVESTQHLAKIALKNPDFKRFVHVSTIGVHGHIENPPGDESSPYSPGDLYQKTKLEGELWLRDFAQAHSLPFSVIRPTAIYGPGDRRLLKFFKMATWRFFPILGHGKCLYHLVHVEDLTNAIMLAATHEKALGETFIVGPPDDIKLEDFAKIVAGICGCKNQTVRIPVGPFFILARICEAVCRPFGIEPPIYQRRVAFYTKDRSFNTAKLRNHLGYQAIYDNKTGISETTNWYIEKGWLKSKCQPGSITDACDPEHKKQANA